MRENELKCCVSGSFFKFKKEIDTTIDEFRGLGFTVLAPDKGWLYIPKHLIGTLDLKFRPLPTERGMDSGQIEDSFLESIRKSNFLYVDNHEGYIGDSVSLEIGFTIAHGISIFSRNKMVSNEVYDLWWGYLTDRIIVAQPSEIRGLLRDARE